MSAYRCDYCKAWVEIEDDHEPGCPHEPSFSAALSLLERWLKDEDLENTAEKTAAFLKTYGRGGQ